MPGLEILLAHAYFSRYDPKQTRKMKPYPPLATLHVAGFLRRNGHSVALFDAFYRAGSLVFGGGHVVLPLLQAEVVPPGWVDNETFLAGYGAAQAVPGPLFTFAAYLGAVFGLTPIETAQTAGSGPARGLNPPPLRATPGAMGSGGARRFRGTGPTRALRRAESP